MSIPYAKVFCKNSGKISEVLSEESPLYFARKKCILAKSLIIFTVFFVKRLTNTVFRRIMRAVEARASQTITV